MTKRNAFSISRLSYFATLLFIGILWTTFANAQSVTLAILDVDTTGTAVEFKTVAKCANKAQGNYGCLKMATGNSGPLNFVLQGSPGWDFEWIQIREPFANWLDAVPANILSDLQEIGGPGGNFFNANGEHTFAGNTKFFNINDLNTSKFTIQYRIAVTDGTTTLIAHPILENEG